MTTRIKIVQKLDKTLNVFVGLVLTVVIMFGLYSIWDTWQLINGGASGSSLTHFKPNAGDATHQSIADLQALNSDISAWLTVDGTAIDQPVLHGKDNFEYLTLNYLKDYSLLGSLFLDSQCDPTFKSSYELIHGHHMTESMMFGDLEKFEDKNFFKDNSTGYLMTVNETYKLEIFACLHIEATDPYVYSTYNTSAITNQALLTHIKQTAMHLRECDVKGSDQILALSTCANGKTSYRTVVFAKMVKQ